MESMLKNMTLRGLPAGLRSPNRKKGDASAHDSGSGSPQKLAPATASNHFLAPVTGHHDRTGSSNPGSGFTSNLHRRGSIASFASAVRKSPSMASIMAMVEEPTRNSLPTKCIENNQLRVPMNVDHGRLCPELVAWAKSPRLNDLKSSARLMPNYNYASSAVQLVADDDERMVARSGDDVFVFLQVADFLAKGVPQNVELFYVVTTPSATFASKPWPALEKPTRTNEPFLLPYADQINIGVFARLPVTPGKKKSGLMGSLKKKVPQDHLQGAEISLGEVHLDLQSVDFGKEAATLTIAFDPRLRALLHWTVDADAELTVRLGVWTGAGPRIRSQREAFHSGYLTIQTNPRCPTWRRYWAVIDTERGVLQLFDFEYKTTKLHRVLSLGTVTAVRPADPEEYPIPHTFVMVCPGAFAIQSSSDLYASNDTLVSVEAAKWVCRADTDADMDRWMQSLAATSRMVRAQAKSHK
ncbi:hypothetical protein H9P43_007184 [Blastocladiella emersonii ATCC 22665]|nr:hypothetical protein H9P43_007184 [Blastocladiella emersonii ATCC 22665]